MNSAQEYAMAYCLSATLTEVILMNRLQGAGVISDNCVWLGDIATADQPAAIKWMAKNIN